MRLRPSLMCGLLLACACLSQAAEQTALEQQVRDAEQAFAATMASRDHAAFAALIAPEAVFFNGDQPLRGREAVVSAWKKFFEGPAAPFSWRPEQVVVLESGALAHSTGPVFDPKGVRVATFNSVWRREPDGRWLVVFDRGCDVCACAERAAP